MRHARADYERFQDPAGKIPAAEPVMLFRGQDRFAARVLRYYAHLLASADADRDIIRAVQCQADAMDAWPVKKTPDL
jgi:L-lysine 2,3-aminomutase